MFKSPKVIATALVGMAGLAGGGYLIANPGVGEDGPTPTPTPTHTASPATLTGKFLHISDIHFDPTADGVAQELAGKGVDEWEATLEAVADKELSYNRYSRSRHKKVRTDSNYFLMKSALDAAKDQGPYDFIVYTGDYLPHYFAGDGQNKISDKKFKEMSIAFVNRMMEKRFGADTPLVAALGNNDAAYGDYNLQPGGTFLGDIADDFPLVDGNTAAETAFKAGGNYVGLAKDIPFDFVTLSVFWSKEYPAQTRNCKNTDPTAGADQLKFLDGVLSSRTSSSKPLLLVTHIPPGVNGFSAHRHQEARYNWCDKLSYDQKFKKLTAKYPKAMSLGFAGHTHMDEFRVLSDGGTPYLGIRVGPAVTTWNGNLPSFTTMTYDPAKAEVTDYTVFMLTNVEDNITPKQAKWAAEYTFSTAYKAPSYSPATLYQIASDIQADKSPARKSFTENYKPGTTYLNDWRYYGCATSIFEKTPYEKCAVPR